MRRTILSFLTLACSAVCFGQISIGNTFGEGKWRVGGSAGLGGSFGDNSGWSLNLAPRLGYALSPAAEVGLIGNFSYSKSDWYTSTNIGIGPYMQYYIGSRFFAQALYQHYFISVKDKYSSRNFSANEDALYLGGGYLQPIGRNASLQFGLMYNVLYNEKTSYQNGALIPSIGVVMGL